MNKEELSSLFGEFLEKHFGASSKEAEPVAEVTKAVDEEERMAMFVVLAPQEGDTTTDLHGDTYTADEVWKACNNYNTHCNKANIFHRVETEKAKIVQSFITPNSFTTDDGREITKGSWLQWWHFPEGDAQSDLMWKAVKSGEITGVSIGAVAKVEAINGED